MNSIAAVVWTPDARKTKVAPLLFLGDFSMFLPSDKKAASIACRFKYILRTLEGVTGVTAANDYPIK